MIRPPQRYRTDVMRSLVVVAIGISALVGCTRDDDTGIDTTTVVPGVNFLMFPNPQASLAVGDYSIVTDNSSGSAVAYTLTISSTDGGSQTITGSIPAGNNNTVGTFEQKNAGGVTINLNTGGTSIALRLCLTGTTCTSASTNVASASGANPSIDLPRYQIDSVTYTQEYYKAIDPLNERTTLAAFKTKNGFGATCAPNSTNEFEVRFRDVLDLGYGRHMCARGSTTAAGDIAFWVENFQVTAIPGNKYGPLNLEAVVTDDRRWHIGTNAIEYSPGPNGGARFAKFYTFNPDGTRRTLVDLDGRGAKAMPIPCISCHGGRAPPLLATAIAVAGGGGVASRFPDMPNVARGSTLARLQPINVDTLDLAPVYPYRRVDQETSLKSLNKLVLCSYPLVGAAAGAEDNCRTAVTSGDWQGTNAALVKTWYGGNGMTNPTQSDSYLPSGWNAGAEQNIYRTVVAPNCRVCHSLRGLEWQSDIDFTTYAKFSGYADQIKHHVFDKGNMPLAQLKFDHFWESNAPSTLASIVPGSTTGGGSVLNPNRPVAIAGPDRVVGIGTTKLSAAESTNATSYSWSTSAPCSFAAGENTKIRPTLTTALGTCTVQLTVSDGSTTSNAATLTVVVSASPPSTGTRFSNILTDILRGAPGCSGCHCSACGYTQIPLYYAAAEDYDGDGSGTDDTEDRHQLYLNVRARINFTDIANSPLLRKPSGNHHCGGTPLPSTGTPGDAGRALYDEMLNWILTGAPE